ncbi:MAG: hypothetical protein Q7S17_07780 [Xanthobacteraceae bacterium]|nr:hypothetical protein [Xanthobacteraceae bacterium]
MSTFLQICQMTSRESGTVHGVEPKSTTGQIGRLAKVVAWTAEAWREVQNLHDNWRWMRAEFPSTALTVAGTARYTPASWNITDLASWVTERRSVSIYVSATGVSDEGEISFMPDWIDYRAMYDRGTQNNNRPTHWAISPANEFCLGSKPNAVFRVKGEYMKTAVTLSDSTDTPLCPVRFHPIIAWKAVMLLCQHDEAPLEFFAGAQQKYTQYLSDLRRDQLPKVRIASEPLA